MGRLDSMTARLQQMWRQIGTGIAFAMFGLGGLLMTITVFPAINLFFRDPVRRANAAQRTVHAAWKTFIWTVVKLGVIGVRTYGGEILRNETGTLVIANHPSLLDVVLIMSLMDRTQCVVKPGVWNNPFMRGVVKATNYIPNIGDPEKTLDDCVAALKAGNNLVIFPEGSRTIPGAPVRLKRGFANIAIRAGAPIRLVTVECEPPILRKGDKWYQSPLRKPCFHVRVGDRLDIADICCTDEAPARAARNLTAFIAKRFEELMPNEFA